LELSIVSRHLKPIEELHTMEVNESNRLSILNQAITITAEEAKDEGASTRYCIHVRLPRQAASESKELEIEFQSGAVGPDGSNVNGISDESLIEVLIHRLKAFQAGPWASETNATALRRLEQALAALEQRTAARRKANVEGTTRLMAGEKGHGE
jgi:hypothetical protein